LLLTGKIISADEGLRIGLVSRVVPLETLRETALATAKEILACGSEARQQLLVTMRGDLVGLPAALEHEAEMQSINYSGAEFAEGIAAVREKRAPKFN
jgi:enoyl-CoA hydratase